MAAARWLVPFLSMLASIQVGGQTWCGKNYIKGHPVAPPNGQFGKPKSTGTWNVSLRCIPRYSLYLTEDATHTAQMLVEVYTHKHSFDAKSLDSLIVPDLDQFNATIGLWYNQKVIALMETPLNNTILVPFSLNEFSPRSSPQPITCNATLRSSENPHKQILTTTAVLSYLPNAIDGSITKIDRLTGAMLARPAKRVGEPFNVVYPFGFYTSFGNYLDSDLAILDKMKEQGFIMVHPVPPFENTERFVAVLDRMEQLGLYLVYDMRHSYKNLSLVAEEIEAIRNRTNLLLWYTADEPDGPGDEIDRPRETYDLIYASDGYHPVGLALNCDDFHFESYGAGADVIIVDPYMIGINATYSVRYDTPCTTDFGCCGCDNCQGDFADLSGRLDVFAERLDILGWKRTKQLWSVTQAFGGEEFWRRAPTGREWLVQGILSINHGAAGIMPWIDPAPSDIKEATAAFSGILRHAKRFLFDVHAIITSSRSQALDVKTWKLRGETFILAVNPDQNSRDSMCLPEDAGVRIQWLLKEGVEIEYQQSTRLVFDPLGVAVLLIVDDTRVHDEL